MPAFMNTTEKAGRQFGLVYASRNPYIRRVERRGKGMSRQVEPAALEVVSHRHEDEPAELYLVVGIIRVVQKTVIDLSRAGGGRLKEWYETGL